MSDYQTVYFYPKTLSGDIDLHAKITARITTKNEANETASTTYTHRIKNWSLDTITGKATISLPKGLEGVLIVGVSGGREFLRGTIDVTDDDEMSLMDSDYLGE